MSYFKTVLSKTSSVKSIVFLFIISHGVLLLMMTYTFPVINAQIGAKAFDLHAFGYTFSQATTIVNNLNEHATSLYIFPQLLLLDILYPFLLALFLSSFIYRLKNITKSKISFFLLLTPFLAMFFDYLENGCILLMITKSVELTATFVTISSTLTMLKSVCTTVAWFAVLYFTFKWFKLKIKHRKQ